MTSLATGHRYTVEQASYGWDVIDTETGESVGICPTEREAAKTAQQLNALHNGNVIRLARAQVKREIRNVTSQQASRETLAAVLEDDPPCIATMRIEALLSCVWKMQAARRARTLAYAGCSALKVVADLTARQRALLCEALRMETNP